jgi:hypothetical protein
MGRTWRKDPLLCAACPLLCTFIACKSQERAAPVPVREPPDAKIVEPTPAVDAASVEAPGLCRPLAGYCGHHSDLWGRCEDLWILEQQGVCSHPMDHYGIYERCEGYDVVVQAGADYHRVLYYGADHRLAGVSESYALARGRGPCFGVVPPIRIDKCAASRTCRGP